MSELSHVLFPVLSGPLVDGNAVSGGSRAVNILSRLHLPVCVERSYTSIYSVSECLWALSSFFFFTGQWDVPEETTELWCVFSSKIVSNKYQIFTARLWHPTLLPSEAARTDLSAVTPSHDKQRGKVGVIKSCWLGLAWLWRFPSLSSMWGCTKLHNNKAHGNRRPWLD